ncbi:MAG: hypothetical protein R3E31_05485 [Chloroflexota bacterium]
MDSSRFKADRQRGTDSSVGGRAPSVAAFILDPAAGFCLLAKNGWRFCGRGCRWTRTCGSGGISGTAKGEATAVFTQLQQEIEIGAIFAAEDFSPYARQRGSRFQSLPASSTARRCCAAPDRSAETGWTAVRCLHHLARPGGSSRCPPQADLLPAPAHSHSGECDESADSGTAVSDNRNSFQAGETAAQQQLDQFTATHALAHTNKTAILSRLMLYIRPVALPAFWHVIGTAGRRCRLTAYRQAITATTDANGKGATPGSTN